jgi:hypothetical protein
VKRIRPIAASVTAWTVGATTAVGVGLISLTLIGGGFGEGPIAPHDLGQPTEPAAPGIPRTLSPAATTTTPVPADRTIASRGGTVIARCHNNDAYLVGWSPAPGFRPDGVVRGPAATVKVVFVAYHRSVRVTVTCSDGLLEPTITDLGTDE